MLADGSRIADGPRRRRGRGPARGRRGWRGRASTRRLHGGIRTALPHVYAAGDVTGGGHWEAAARQGAGVARALLGLAPAPPAPPSFWSDQLGLRLQCVGEPAGARATIAADPEGRGFEAVYRRDGPHQRRPARRPLRRRPARRPPSPDPRTPAREERRMTLIPEIDTFACVAHGDCAVVAPQAFRVDDVAVVIGVAPDDVLLEAARACPAGAIVLRGLRDRRGGRPRVVRGQPAPERPSAGAAATRPPPRSRRRARSPRPPRR